MWEVELDAIKGYVYVYVWVYVYGCFRFYYIVIVVFKAFPYFCCVQFKNDLVAVVDNCLNISLRIPIY
jgi:hypothetical protein